MAWTTYALLSALAAALTAILGKVGLRGIPSNLATAIRTIVILLFAWGLVVARGELSGLRDIRVRTLLFLALSGLATGISWLAYYKALQMAPATKVSAVDRLSLPLTMMLALLFLHEGFGIRAVIGVALMVVGAVLTVLD